MSRIAALWLLLWPLAATGLSPLEIEEWILEPSVGVEGRQHFAWAVARVPGLVVVGANADSETAPSAGAGYAFLRDGDVWIETKLVPGDGMDGDRAGIEVAIAGDRAVLASYHNNERGPTTGAVYVFGLEGGNWVEEAKLLGSDLVERDAMGISVAAQRDEILAGAPYAGNQRQLPGSVYVFQRDGTRWYEAQKLTPADAQPGDRFGLSVAVSRDLAVVRSDQQWGSLFFQRGLAYVFRRGESGWEEEAKIVPRSAGRSGFTSVAAHGDRLLLGAAKERVAGQERGGAHVFRHDGSGWIEEGALFASDGAAGDNFGEAVAIWNDIALVSARTTEFGLRSAGATYVFRFDGESWVEQSKLLASEPSFMGVFGLRLRLVDGVAITGSNLDRAYLLDLRERVSVDIAPRREPNRIDPLSPRSIGVAVLGAPDFEVGSILTDSLRFGPAGAPPRRGSVPRERDVDRDGHLDLVSRHSVRDAGIAVGDREACLVGERSEGLPFRGCDAIETTPRCGGGVELALLAPPLLWLRRRPADG